MSQQEPTSETIIDCHHHFITTESVNAFQKMFTEVYEKQLENPEMIKFIETLPTPEVRAKKIVQDMKKSAVDQVLLMSFSGDFDASHKAHKMFPNEFPGIIPFVDPRFDEPEVIEGYKKRGAVAIKFQTSIWGYDLRFDDTRLFPYLEKCLELELVPMIHFGVVKGGIVTLDQWPSNPLQLRPWLQHPKLQHQKYIISHFGAGYLREILLMAYTYKKRILVDTSGSNDWISWSPWQDLTQVFEKAILTLSPKQILFGTDSGIRMMRHDIILNQKEILDDFVTRKVITDIQRWDILGNNTKQ
ncbi:MAG: amidohydrolase family protein, partial [Candidatus Hodarchaeales archaeon]